MAAIEHEVYGHDRCASNVRVRTITVCGGTPSALSALCEALEVSTECDRRSLLLALSKVFRWQRWVLLVDLSSLDDPTLQLHAFEALCGELRALPAAAMVTMVFVLRSGSQRRAFDFARGLPLVSPLGYPSGAQAWRCYVHLRLAWECAGEPSQARRWGDVVSKRVAPENDDALERCLNELACEVWRARPEGLRKALSAWLNDPDEARVEPLIAEGVLWRPRRAGPLRPTPYVARALLCEGSSHGRAQLRTALVCAPLVEAILGVCLELEGMLRGTVRPTGEVGPETLEAWERFNNGSQRNGRSLLPEGCPAGPVDAWDMAPFGEFIAACSWPRERYGVLHDLRGLRNDVAHGHYVSWRNILALRTILRSFPLTEDREGV
jgi:hypothetical protein